MKGKREEKFMNVLCTVNETLVRALITSDNIALHLPCVILCHIKCVLLAVAIK